MDNTLAQQVESRFVQISAALFDNEKDVVPKRWTGPLARLLGEIHQQRESKAGTPCYSMVTYRDGANRGNSGVEHVTAIVLDLDHVTDDQLAQAWRWLSGFAGAMYSTYSDRVSSPSDRCARIVLLVARPLSPEEAKIVRDVVAQQLGVPTDEHATDPARLWYMPACPCATHSGAFIAYTAGAVLDPDPLLVSANGAAHNKQPAASPLLALRDLITNGAYEGHRNVSITQLAGYLLGKGVDVILTLHLLLAWNACNNVPPLPYSEVEAVVNSIAGRELCRQERRRGR